MSGKTGKQQYRPPVISQTCLEMILALLASLTLAALAAVIAMANAAESCPDGLYLLSATGECLTADECLARGKETREGGFCRVVHYVHTEADLLAMEESPYDAYVLTRDIRLSSPVASISFQGELDGQGHWIRNISFDLETAREKGSLRVGLLRDAEVLKNLGLEVGADLRNSGETLETLWVGAAVGEARSLQLARNVRINGSISVEEGNISSGEGRIRTVFLGGLLGRQSPEAPEAVLGQNLTLQCALRCRAWESCKLGGIAGELENAQLEGVAVIGKVLAADAPEISLGGLCGWGGTLRVQSCFADVEELIAWPGKGAARLGGLLGHADEGALQDSYVSCWTLRVEAKTDSGMDFYVSPLVAQGRGRLSLERCYGRVRGSVEVEARQQRVQVGGLAASVGGELEASGSFTVLEDVWVDGARHAYLGGLVQGATTARLEGCWTRLEVSRLSSVWSAQLGGICESCGSGTELRDLEVELGLADEITGLGRSGALAGGLGGASLERVFVEWHCIGKGCTPLALVGEGEIRARAVYAAPENGGIEGGALPEGSFVLTTGKFGADAYPELAWDFHGAEEGYPTLPGLPAPDRAGRALFANGSASSWAEDVWVVPDARENAPQLVTNPRCANVSGGGLCAFCPEEACLECAGERVPSADGLSCGACPAGLGFDKGLRECTKRGCPAVGCEACDLDGSCLRCRSGLYLNQLEVAAVERAGATGACLGQADCEGAGGVARGEEKGKPATCMPGCAEGCRDCRGGSCRECEDGFALNELGEDSQGVSGQCITRAGCRDSGGVLEENRGGGGMACAPDGCKVANCEECGPDRAWCRVCRDKYSLEWRWPAGGEPGRVCVTGEGVSTAAVAGIVGGCLVLLGLLAGSMCAWTARRRAKRGVRLWGSGESKGCCGCCGRTRTRDRLGFFSEVLLSGAW